MTPVNSYKYFLSTILFFVPIFFWAQTNTAPTLTASGDQYYCPQSQINVVTDFNIVDPDDNDIEAVYVQISTGYVNGEDTLTLTGNHPNITTTWSVSEGKLTLKSSTGGNALYDDLIAAVKEVIFESSNTNPTIDKSFSITIGDANYLPSTEHFYEYIPNNGITWTSAKTAAEGRDYFGLQGYLATITSPEEAQLSGEQAEGQGWLGGSDEETEGTWKWVTGPEAGDTFWFGLANGNSNGADHTYTNWSAGEPNDWPNPGIPSEENYLHVYSDGNWNDYPNNNNNIQGYIVEYGGTPGDPILNISASTTIKMAKITATTTDTSCGTGQVTLSATSNTGFVLWFDSSNGGTKLASGNTFSPTISATTTYYALASADGVCENGPRIAVTGTYYNIPTITSTTDTIICESGTGTLTATASVGTINWYNSATGGVSIASGTSYTTPTLTSTTIYYVDATENGCTTTTRTPVTATIQDTSTPTGNTTQTFCDIENATISNLTVVGNTIQWYANSSGGTPLNATDLLTSATNYYATQTINGCESPSRLAVNVLVFETVIPSTTNILLEECDNSSDGDDTNGFTFFDLTSKEIELLNGKNLLDFTIKYFKEDTYLISSEITDPSNFQNTSINGQTVYARIFNNLDTTCFTDTSFEIQVNALPTITSTTDTIICESGTGTLTATASVGTINWYNSATGGVSIASGTSYTTPTLTSTTIYYVDATENGCTTTTRTPVTATIQDTSTPTGNTTQTFCDIENATISNLTVVGNTIQWYANSSGGTPLNATDLLTSATNYYATQTINGCESPSRLAVNVLVFETVIPSTTNILLEECDNSSDGDDTNGFTFFDLTSKEIELLNGKNLLDFTIKYFKEDTYLISSEITDPSNFQNTSINGQTVYARIFNNLDTTCFTDTSFEIQVNTLPVIQSTIVFKNCDEDGTSDGFTDFNLEEADPFITNNNQDIVTYYLTYAEADNSTTTALSSPFNNQDAVNNEVFARVENSFGCHRVATVNLDVSATKLPAGFDYEIESCDQDDIIDGKAVFNLTEATQYYINTLPPQNLSVHYYRNLLDAQLEQNEILTPTNYENEIPFLQTLYVRVENDDNGACFGIGEHLTLIVHPRPEFEVNPEAMVCLNLPPITLQIFNPNGIYTYKWTDELNSVISNQPTAFVSKGGVYTVVATSTAECASFERTVNVSESKIASITLNDIAVTDDSNNNSITINTLNLGIGDYEFAMDDIDGLYQNEPVFSNVAPGIRTIYVRDKNNCGIASIEVSVIGFPKFLTPNNDGYNDRWSILGATDEFYESAQIMIFNRFGKYITTIDSTKDAGWNGSYNGVILTASDYWFKAQLTDKKGNVREKSGHFSLITH